MRGAAAFKTMASSMRLSRRPRDYEDYYADVPPLLLLLLRLALYKDAGVMFLSVFSPGPALRLCDPTCVGPFWNSVCKRRKVKQLQLRVQPCSSITVPSAPLECPVETRIPVYLRWRLLHWRRHWIFGEEKRALGRKLIVGRDKESVLDLDGGP